MEEVHGGGPGVVHLLYDVVALADVLLGVLVPELRVRVVKAQDRKDNGDEELVHVGLEQLVRLRPPDAV